MKVVVTLCLLAAVARAEPPAKSEANSHLQAALSSYAQRQYEAAITEFRAAYELDPRREILFAWAQAERLSGDCPSAVLLYRKFLGTHPSEAEEAAARLNLKKCEDALATKPEAVAPEQPQPSPRPEAAPPDRPSVAATPMVTRPAPPWWRDRVGLAFAIVGGLGLIGGIAMEGASASLESSAHAATSYGQYGDRLDLARGLRTGGFVCIGIGAALGIVSVVRFVVIARRGRPVRAWLMPSATGFVVEGAF
jgi:tetratricopeptide (TPR) repeat protein